MSEETPEVFIATEDNKTVLELATETRMPVTVGRVLRKVVPELPLDPEKREEIKAQAKTDEEDEEPLQLALLAAPTADPASSLVRQAQPSEQEIGELRGGLTLG